MKVLRKYNFFYIFIISIIFVFISCASDISKKIDENLEYLYKYWEQGYVAYDEARGNGLKLEKNIKKIKRLYKKQVRFSKKNNPQNVLYENGIDKYSLGVLIQSLTFDKAKIKDTHYRLDSESVLFALHSEYAFFSDVYFKFIDGDYFLISSSLQKIPIGLKYTGNIENLKKTIINREIFYNFIVFSNKKIQNYFISLEKQLYEIPVYEIITKNSNDSFFLQDN